MAIIVACPCGKQYRVKDEAAGKRFRCQSCGNLVAIPGPAPAAPPAVPPRRATSPARASAGKEAVAPKSSRWLVPVGGGVGVLLLAVAVGFVILRSRGTTEPGPSVSPPTDPQLVSTPPTTPEAAPPAPGKTSAEPAKGKEEATPTKPPANTVPPPREPAPKAPAPKEPTPKEPIRPTPPPPIVTGPLPRLKQTIRSVRVVLAEALDTEKIRQRIQTTYEPRNVKVVFGRPADTEVIAEDAVLVGTYFSNPGMFGQKNENAYYLWVDREAETLETVDVRGGFTSGVDDVSPPLFIFDPSPLIDVRVGTSRGKPTDDLKYVLLREGSVPETIAIYDVAEKRVVGRQKVQGSYTDRLIVGSQLLCSVNDRGIELFELSALPQLGRGYTYFTDVESNKIQQVVIHRRSVVALVDNLVYVWHWPEGTNGGPQLTFTRIASAEIAVNSTGQVRLFAAAKEGAAGAAEVRLGTLSADGKLSIQEQTPRDRLKDDDGWAPNRSGRLEARLNWKGRLELWWHDGSASPRHLVDVSMGTKNQIKAKQAPGLPQVAGQSLLMAGPLLAFSLLDTDAGVRRLPGGALLVYSGGNIVRLKPFAAEGATPAVPPSKPAENVPPPVLNRLQQAQIKLETVAVERAAAIREAEVKGKDIRTELEKSRDRLTIARYKLGPDRDRDLQRKLKALQRWNAILEARQQGQDVRTVGEKLDETYFAALNRDPPYRAACQRLRRACAQPVANPAQPVSDLEMAVQLLIEDLVRSSDYTAAAEKFRRLRQPPAGSSDEPFRLSGWLDPDNNAPVALAAWTRVEVFMLAALKR